MGQGQGQGQARTEVAGALQLRREERMSVCLARPCCSSCLLVLVLRLRLPICLLCDFCVFSVSCLSGLFLLYVLSVPDL